MLIFFTLLYQVDLVFACHRIDEFKTRLTIEQINFLSSDLNDVTSIQATISSIYQLDQELRTIYIHDRNNNEVKTFMLEMDQFHTQKMKEIIRNHGWPTITLFGKNTDHQAWLLVQHSSDLEFQKNCLQLLYQAMQCKETNPINYAYLYDRVALQSKEYDYKQKYGTQFHITNNGELILQPYQGTIEDIDKNRFLIGLSSLEEYTTCIKKMYKILP